MEGVNVVEKGENLGVSSVRNSMGEELTRENDIEIKIIGESILFSC